MQQTKQPVATIWPFCTYLLVLGFYLSELGWDGFAITAVVVGGLVFLTNFVTLLAARGN